MCDGRRPNTASLPVNVAVMIAIPCTATQARIRCGQAVSTSTCPQITRTPVMLQFAWICRPGVVLVFVKCWCSLTSSSNNVVVPTSLECQKKWGEVVVVRLAIVLLILISSSLEHANAIIMTKATFLLIPPGSPVHSNCARIELNFVRLHRVTRRGHWRQTRATLTLSATRSHR